MAQSPCFYSPCWIPFAPFFVPFTYLETLLAVTGSVHLGLRLLVNWPPLPQPFPIPSPLQIPNTQVTKRLTMTTSIIRLLLSGTVLLFFVLHVSQPIIFYSFSYSLLFLPVSQLIVLNCFTCLLFLTVFQRIVVIICYCFPSCCVLLFFQS